MSTIWFMIVAVMIAAYVVLDGFDIGAGAVHLFIAKNDEERRTVLRAIGPVWDGNEVWLLAAGGTLYFAFPLLYAASFSGFYLPLMMVLWLLMLRAIGIEFRTHLQDKLWKGFFDVIFGVASILLASLGQPWAMWYVGFLSMPMATSSNRYGRTGALANRTASSTGTR
jgi:cytochrome bd ubiquinol oxidase subunit II